MKLTIARELPMQINEEINHSDVTVIGPTNTKDLRGIILKTASLHFKNYHLYLNPPFDYLDGDNVVMADSSLAYNDLKRGHRVHIFISKKSPSFTKTSLLQDFILNSFNATGHPVIIHVMKEYTTVNDEPFDELYDAVVTGVHTAKEINQIQNAGEPRAKICPFKFVRDCPGAISIFKVDDFVKQDPNIINKCRDLNINLTSCYAAAVEFDKYHHIIYSLGYTNITRRKEGMHNDG